MNLSSFRRVVYLGVLASSFLVVLGESVVAAQSLNSGRRLLDLSGLVWLDGDTFLAVSDAKNPDEPHLNRLSVLTLPESLDGLGFRPIRVRYPGGPSSDFESAAGIPGTPYVLLAESADDASDFQRIFLAEVRRNRARIVDVTSWSDFTDAFNIEATATSTSGEGRLFFWAERNQGEQYTHIYWAPLGLDPFTIGPISASVFFELPADLVDDEGEPLFNRPIVAMDIDADGQMYIAATLDPEGISPNPDNGPWRSILYRIGTVDENGLSLDSEFTEIAVMDGLKIESIAVRDVNDEKDIFVGTDDENFGGVLRQVIIP